MASSSIIIEEQTGQRRTLVLTGSGLPLQGADWPSEVVAPTTWYPGNRQASQQVLMPKRMPSNWSFEWRTNRLARTPALLDGQKIERAATLFEAMDSILMSGQRLRVSFVAQSDGGTQMRKSLFGVMTKLTPKVDRPDDIMADVEFTWSGDADQQQKLGVLRSEGQLSARINAVKSSDAVAKAILDQRMRSRIPTDPLSADRFSLGQLEQLVEAPRKVVEGFARTANGFSNRVKQLGDIIEKARSTPDAIAGSALDIANNAIGVATNFTDVMSRDTPESWSNRMKVSTLLRTAAYYNGAMRQSDLMAIGYQTLAEQSRKRRSGIVTSPGYSRASDSLQREDAYQLHIPKSGETFADLGRRYYDNAELGDEIARANGLPGYTVMVPRMPIVVPVRRALEDANRNRV